MLYVQAPQRSESLHYHSRRGVVQLPRVVRSWPTCKIYHVVPSVVLHAPIIKESPRRHAGHVPSLCAWLRNCDIKSGYSKLNHGLNTLGQQ